ncbi:MAG: lysylphosphatidylglycerol synthase transmembrane domain-containing protein [Acidimicrobiales bacterium]
MDNGLVELSVREDVSGAATGTSGLRAASPAGPEAERPATFTNLQAGSARTGRWRAWARFGLGLLLLATVVGVVVRAPSGAVALASASRHFGVRCLPWLALSGASEVAALGAAALAQSRLLRAGGSSVRFSSLFGITLAANAVADLVPAGVAPASGWLVGQYRSRGASSALAVWVVLASGFAIALSLMGLLLVGAGIAGIWAPTGLVAAGVALVGGSAACVAAARRLASGPWLQGHFNGRIGRRLGDLLVASAHYRASVAGGAIVLAYALVNWLLNAGPLVLGFVMLGLPVPWRSLLFAYAASQVASGLSFLPSGLGPLQGGMVGGFVLAGTPAAPALAASLLYSAVAYWAVAGAGAVTLVVQAHRSQRRWQPLPEPGHGLVEPGWAARGRPVHQPGHVGLPWA